MSILATMPPKASSASSPCSAAPRSTRQSRACTVLPLGVRSTSLVPTCADHDSADRRCSQAPSSSETPATPSARSQLDRRTRPARTDDADSVAAHVATHAAQRSRRRRRTARVELAKPAGTAPSSATQRCSAIAPAPARASARSSDASPSQPRTPMARTRGSIQQRSRAPRARGDPAYATPISSRRSAVAALAPHHVRRTPGISCEAVPASMPLTGAGMRRHVHAGNHAAESFVSFIPLFGGAATHRAVRPPSAVTQRIARIADEPSQRRRRRATTRAGHGRTSRSDRRRDSHATAPRASQPTRARERSQRRHADRRTRAAVEHDRHCRGRSTSSLAAVAAIGAARRRRVEWPLDSRQQSRSSVGQRSRATPPATPSVRPASARVASVMPSPSIAALAMSAEHRG